MKAQSDLARYNDAIAALLDQPVRWKDPQDRALGVEMDALHFSPDARSLYVDEYNAIEAEEGPDGKLASVKPFASKLLENAARMAGAFTLLEDPIATEIDAATLADAIKLARFYLGEARRLQAAGAIDPDLQLAERLRRWLLDRPGQRIGLTEVYQLGPNALRQADKARTAMHTLEAHGWVRSIEGGAVIDGKRCMEAWEIVHG